jgi:hypothetical protein
MADPFAFAGHLPPPLPALAKCAPDAPIRASGRERLRSLAADLVVASFDVVSASAVARTLGLSRQTVHQWGDPARAGASLAHLLGGPRAWSGFLLRRALVVVDGPTPRWSATPQALVARVIAGAAQVAAIIGQRNFDQCTPEELERMRRDVAEKRGDLAELERQIVEAQEKKRQQQGGDR